MLVAVSLLAFVSANPAMVCAAVTYLSTFELASKYDYNESLIRKNPKIYSNLIQLCKNAEDLTFVICDYSQLVGVVKTKHFPGYVLH